MTVLRQTIIPYILSFRLAYSILILFLYDIQKDLDN
jgi:hypothetical protein